MACEEPGPDLNRSAAGAASVTLVSHCKVLRILLVTIACFGASWLVAAEEDSVASAPEHASWSGTVLYDQSLLVLTTREQAVVVRFLQPKLFGSRQAGRFIVPYEWRAMTHNEPEQTGEGRLVEDYRKGQRIRNESTLRAGAVNIEWTSIDEQSGRYSFDPQHVLVQQIDRTWFEDRSLPGPSDRVREAVSLPLFLESSVKVTDFFTNEDYNGPHTAPTYPRSPLFTNITYARHGLIIATPVGVGAICFGEPVLEEDENTRRTGVKYRYRFHSMEDDSEGTGVGEVWEVAVNGRNDYNAARHYIEAGPVHLPWSKGGTGSGWIYFDPGFHTVSFVDPDEAAAIIDDPAWQPRLAEFNFVERPPGKPRESPNQ